MVVLVVFIGGNNVIIVCHSLFGHVDDTHWYFSNQHFLYKATVSPVTIEQGEFSWCLCLL
jgi:hypothetical protein